MEQTIARELMGNGSGTVVLLILVYVLWELVKFLLAKSEKAHRKESGGLCEQDRQMLRDIHAAADMKHALDKIADAMSQMVSLHREHALSLTLIRDELNGRGARRD